MRAVWLAGAIVCLAISIGCGSGTQKAVMTPGTGAVSAGVTETGALAAAGESYCNSIGGAVEFGEYVPFPIAEGILLSPDETNLVATVDYSHYMEAIQGTGWKSLDEFSSHPTGYSASVKYGNEPDTPDDLSLWLVQGGYAQNLGKSVVKANIGLGGASQGGSSDDIFESLLGYDYYIARNFSLGLALSYEHIKYDDGDTSSDGRYYLNIGYLFDMVNPVLLKFSYGRMEVNSSDGALNDLVLSADWVIKEKFLVGVAASRMSDSDSWSDFIMQAGLNAGYQITPNITAGLGYKMLHFSGSDNDYGGFNVNYSQRF